MANCSDANGQFSIYNYQSLSKGDIKLLLAMIDEILDYVEYNTALHINLIGCNENELSDFINSSCQTLFYGTGRWIYSNNIVNTFESLMSGIEEKQDENYRCLINKMIKHKVMFIFDYYDFEPSANPDVIYKELYTVAPYYDEQKTIKTNIFESETVELKATGEKMIELNYIEEYKTLKEMINEKEEHFINDMQMNKWIEDNEEFFEDGKYVYSPDTGYFILSS